MRGSGQEKLNFQREQPSPCSFTFNALILKSGRTIVLDFLFNHQHTFLNSCNLHSLMITAKGILAFA